ncbi:MAG: LLM class flavin-dependent oxidoreductase [Armatimonadota bacterium]|nr:LLM class flavin-dependent oxidoreductase [Armatimonadota bacterium]MDR7466199.1 LLM class flavin-dependent oxidoreductase [Armatimonadota bacterium]MDR7495118.1 LLM class flavin-dependent oxidoreductase [Armatimonadota bacterium]MDR7500537.1 LLM class flavin-dependent oxidoreductase [Armatimonadota bacterium]MDR7505876.1 LLM class flavin-dependent oxidoreductase [Armatimonadota bacterium]
MALRDVLPGAAGPPALPVGAMVELAALADRNGYHSVWVPEGRGRESFSQLGAMAAVTQRVGLATGILPVFSRPPALAAMALATLDDLSRGRMILGVGTGHPAVSELGYGQRFHAPTEAVREFVDIVRRAMRGERVRYAGRVFQVQDFALETAPPRVVPVYVAALRSRMLRLGGEIGDGVLLNWVPVARARRAAAAVRDTARAAGRDPARISVACFVRACVTDRPAPARDLLRRIIATYAALPSYREMWSRVGFAEEMRAVAAAPEPEAAPGAVSERMVDALGLIGPPETVRRGLEEFRRAGVDLPIVYPFSPEPGDRPYRETLVALSPAG